MRTILKFGLIATCVLTANAFAQDFCNTTTHSGESVEVSSNKVGTIGDVGYELWNEGGNGGSATFYDDGSFNCKMTGAKDYLCRTGLAFNSDKTHEEIGHMKADFKLVKSGLSGIDYSYIGIYGWTREPLVEWYIVDNTGSQYMPGDWVAQGASAKNHGVFEIEGAEQSSSSAEPESSSSTEAIKGIRSMTVGSNTSLVFDAQGKFLGSVEAADAESLNAAIKAKYNSGVYMVKQGRAVRSISVK